MATVRRSLAHGLGTLLLMTSFASGLTPASAAVPGPNVFAWGAGGAGQLGHASAWRTAPTAVWTGGLLAGKSVTSVAAGMSHSCAVASGKVYCWGRSGALGDGGYSDSSVPVAANGALSGKTVSSVSVDARHTCAVAGGKAYCWGDGTQGQLGDGSTGYSWEPVAVVASGALAGKTVTDLSAGTEHTCAVASGKGYCWGSDSDGQLGDGPGHSASSVPVAVTTAGALAGKTVTGISAGREHTCALADGQAYCWGANDWGQLGDGGTNSSDVPVAVKTTGALAGKPVTAVVVAYGVTCVVAEGRAYCWGIGTRHQEPAEVDPGGLLQGKTVAALAMDGSSSDQVCALAEARLYCWGWNYRGQLGAGDTQPHAGVVEVVRSGILAGKSPTTISSGADHSCTVASQQVFCWGDNSFGQLGDGTSASSWVPVQADPASALSGQTVTSAAAGGSHSCAVAAGKLYCWGQYGAFGDRLRLATASPVLMQLPPALQSKTISAVAAGENYTCFLAEGDAYCWGSNQNGQLGNGTTTDAEDPVRVGGALTGHAVTSISLNKEHTCAIADGKAYCWGAGTYGRLGNGTTAQSVVPVAVNTSGTLAGKTVSSIAAGYEHTCVIADGKPYCWGRGTSGQLGNGATGDSSVPVAVNVSGALADRTVGSISAGGSHTCAASAGDAFCWGYGGNGQLGNGDTKSSAVPVAVRTTGALAGKVVSMVSAGGLFTCAVADTKPYCWGSNYYGELGSADRSSTSSPRAVDASGALAGKSVAAVYASEFAGVIAIAGQPLRVPAAPTAVNAVAGDGQAVVGWSAPSDNGGSPILEYEVQTTGSADHCSTTSSTTCTVEGLRNGTAYTFTVRARNSLGWSSPSPGSNPVTPTAAAAPTPISPPASPVVPDPGSGSPTVQQTPASAALAPVTGVKAVSRHGLVRLRWAAVPSASSYSVRVSKPGGKKFGAWKVTLKPSFKAKLKPGAKYRIQIRAVNGSANSAVKTISLRGR